VSPAGSDRTSRFPPTRPWTATGDHPLGQRSGEAAGRGAGCSSKANRAACCRWAGAPQLRQAPDHGRRRPRPARDVNQAAGPVHPRIRPAAFGACAGQTRVREKRKGCAAGAYPRAPMKRRRRHSVSNEGRFEGSSPKRAVVQGGPRGKTSERENIPRRTNVVAAAQDREPGSRKGVARHGTRTGRGPPAPPSPARLKPRGVEVIAVGSYDSQRPPPVAPAFTPPYSASARMPPRSARAADLRAHFHGW